MIMDILVVAGAFVGGTGLFGLVNSQVVIDRFFARQLSEDERPDLDSLSFYTEGTDGQDFRPATVCPHCSAFTYHLFGGESTKREAIGAPEFYDGRRFDSKQVTRSMVRYCLACGKEWSEVMFSGVEKDSIALEVSDERLAKLTQDLVELGEYQRYHGRYTPDNLSGAEELATRLREISDQVNACHDEQREIRRLLQLQRANLSIVSITGPEDEKPVVNLTLPRVIPGQGMEVIMKGHRVSLSASHPALSRIDLLRRDGSILMGTPSPEPMPPLNAKRSDGLWPRPLAHITVRPLATMIHQSDISEEVGPLDQVTPWWRDSSDQLSG